MNSYDPGQKLHTVTKVLEMFVNVPVYEFPTKLPKSLCDEINDYYVNNVAPRPGLLGDKGDSKTDSNSRNVKVRWCQQDDWVGPFIYQYIAQANEHLWQYDITGIYYNNLHHLEYDPGMFHTWHVDSTGLDHTAYVPPISNTIAPLYKEYVRKLSFTLQLSDEEDYTGGDMEFEIPSNKETLDIKSAGKERGTLAIFDPRTRHRITPVESGKRNALVGWVVGPRWK